MLIYVLHDDGDWQSAKMARWKTHCMQIEDTENCYLSPAYAFSHIEAGEIPTCEQAEIRLDLLSVCDVLLIASPVTDKMKPEIEFANLVGIEVRYED